MKFKLMLLLMLSMVMLSVPVTALTTNITDTEVIADNANFSQRLEAINLTINGESITDLDDLSNTTAEIRAVTNNSIVWNSSNASSDTVISLLDQFCNSTDCFTLSYFVTDRYNHSYEFWAIADNGTINTTIAQIIANGTFSDNATLNISYLYISGTNANQNMNISPYTLESGGFIINGESVTDWDTLSNTTAEIQAAINTTPIWVDYSNSSGISRGNTSSEITAVTNNSIVWNMSNASADTVISLLDQYCNSTDCFTLSDFVTDTTEAGSGNTSSEIWAIVDNGTINETIATLMANGTFSDNATLNLTYLNKSGTNADQNINIGIYDLSARYFNGSFNWTSGDTWNIFDGSTLTWNESKLIGDVWFFESNNTAYGTVEGTLSLTQQYDDYDSNSYNITDVVVNGMEWYANTSANVSTEINKICIRYMSEGDDYDVSLFDTTDNGWENYFELDESSSFIWVCSDIRDATEHIVEGKIYVRINDVGVASTQHTLLIDAIYVSSGYTPRVGNEVDPLSIHISGDYDTDASTFLLPNSNWTIYNLTAIILNLAGIPITSWNDVNATSRGNTTAEIRAVTNNSIVWNSSNMSGDFIISVLDLWCNTTDCFSLSDFITDTGSGNTSSEISAIAHNATLNETISHIIDNGTINLTIAQLMANGTLASLEVGFSYTNITDVPDGWRGNTTAEIRAVTNNSEVWNASNMSGDTIISLLDQFCNSTDCFTLSDFITDTIGSGGGSGESKWVDNGTYLTPNSTFANSVNLTEVGAFIDVIGSIYMGGVHLSSMFFGADNVSGIMTIVNATFINATQGIETPNITLNGEAITDWDSLSNTTAEIVAVTNNSEVWNASNMSGDTIISLLDQFCNSTDCFTLSYFVTDRYNHSYEFWALFDNGTLNETISHIIDNGTINMTINMIVYNGTINTTIAQIIANGTLLENNSIHANTSILTADEATITWNLTVSQDIFGNNIYLGTADTDKTIFFYEDANETGETFSWNDPLDAFILSDDVRVEDTLVVGNYITAGDVIAGSSDIYTTGAGDDLWLGDATQGNANLKAYANGTLQAVDTAVSGNATAQYHIGNHSIRTNEVFCQGDQCQCCTYYNGSFSIFECPCTV